MYVHRSSPRRPGACPSIIIPSHALILAMTSSSPLMTPGKFITSPSPRIHLFSFSSSISFTPILAPEVSRFVAGTHDGIMKYTFSGVLKESSIINFIPSTPQTFAISCGSATTQHVPCGITAAANRLGVTSELSICT